MFTGSTLWVLSHGHWRGSGGLGLLRSIHGVSVGSMAAMVVAIAREGWGFL